MAASSLSGIAPLLTLSLSLSIQAMATAHVGRRRHVAMAHDETALRGYDAWEATSGHRARRGK
jgi:hypothetical protein